MLASPCESVFLMQYPQLVYKPEEDKHVYDLPYPGCDRGQMSLAYYRHHEGWTRSQEFSDYMEFHNVSVENVTQLMRIHDMHMWIYAVNNDFLPLDRFRNMANRLLARAYDQSAMSD